jgi:ABC-type branched-subunit amino acid transport system ATPase component
MFMMTDVHVGYGRTTVVHGATVEVSPGGVTAVMGHNGAGKTTLLRAAVGLLHPAPGGSCSTARTSPGCGRTSGSSAAWVTFRRDSSASLN